ncbi:MAG: hypothetical protein JWP12_880 [Bacteroidetes bacterium]|nr:hypothetical protein [Bacteroidota bacterium]
MKIKDFKNWKVKTELSAYRIAANEKINQLIAEAQLLKNIPLAIELIGIGTMILLSNSKTEVDELLNKKLKFK